METHRHRGTEAATGDHDAHGRGHAEGEDHTRGVPATAAVAGHPLHPALVPLPIAFLVGAFGADIGFWLSGEPFWARAALWLTGTGAVTGVVAAALGLIDFATVERARAHRIGWFHALANGVVLVLAAAGWTVRADDPAAVLPWGIVLSGVTAALLVATGWAGGELAYRHMIGVTGHGRHESGSGAEHEEHEEHDDRKHAGLHDGREHARAAGDGHAAPAEAHAAMAHADHMGPSGADESPVTRVTSAQIVAVGALTVLVLVASVVFAAGGWNLTLSARQVGGLVMPPGMIMTRETTAEAMRDMAAVDPRAVSFVAPPDARGDRPLEPRLDDGVKTFDLETSVIRWNILPGDPVLAYTYNRQVPGPRLRVTQGDRVRVNVTNRLPESTTVHWHGLILPNQFDGPAEITQRPIAPGETYTYEFTLEQAGTFFYHSHDHVDRQQALGLYGVLIVDPRIPAPLPPDLAYQHELVVQLQEWLVRDGYTFPAMPMEGALPNFFTINGKAFPATETLRMRVGERVRLRFVGSSSGSIHPMHIHGGPFTIVETDGQPVPEGARLVKDTVNVGPGERYDVIWEARRPGKWLLHCHINHHTTNYNREENGGGGLMLILDVT